MDRFLVRVAGILEGWYLGYATIFTFRRLLGFPAAFEAAAVLLPPIYLFL